MIKFGTSGFRGIIGDNWTKENVQKIGSAFRKMIEAQKKKVNIAIGYDNRFMGRESAVWFCEAACSDQIRATFMKVSVPSPFIAFKALTVDFGIIMTASHNPYEYNGIKVFLYGGIEADDEFCTELTRTIKTLKNVETARFSKLVEEGIVSYSEETDEYVDKIVSLVDAKKIKASGLKVLINTMHGSGAAVARKIIERIGLQFNVLNENIDPYFGGSLPAPYPHNLTGMAKEVVKGKYSFGVALDGDADRVAVIDGDGKYYDCNFLAAALYYYLTQIKKQSGGAVKDFLTSNLIVKLCKFYGFEIHETPVGFKFLGKSLHRTESLLAVESGGMGFKQVSLCKDGIASAAFLIDLVVAMKKSIGEVISEISKLVSFPSVFVQYAYPFAAAEREVILGKLLSAEKPKFSLKTVDINEYSDGLKMVLENDYWCAARLSGNENVLRLYAEMPSEAECGKAIGAMEKFYGMTERQK